MFRNSVQKTVLCPFVYQAVHSGPYEISMTWPQMKCILYYFQDEFPLKLCLAHSSAQRKGKVVCGWLWAGRRKVIQAEEQHPQRSGALHIQKRGAGMVQPDLLIPCTKPSCRGGVISHNLTLITCLIVSLRGRSSVRTPLQGLSLELDNTCISRQSQEHK